MASVGISQTNAGSLAYVYNNLQAAVVGTNASNTNGVIGIPVVQGLEVQSALQLSGNNPGGTAYRQPVNTVSPSGSPIILIRDTDKYARLGFTKSGAFSIEFGLNGTSAISTLLTNTQTNTNSYWGDTSFTTVYAITVQNVSGVSGVNANNGALVLNTAATNSALWGMTNATAISIPVNGGCWKCESPAGFTIAASNAAMSFTPTNGGTVVVAVYGA